MKTERIAPYKTIRYDFNRQSILQITGLTAYKYKEIIFEMGMDWLEHFYDMTDPEQADCRNQFAKNPDLEFWDWFITNWAIREQDLVSYVKWKDMNKDAWINHHFCAMFKLPHLEMDFLDHCRNLNHELI